MDKFSLSNNSEINEGVKAYIKLLEKENKKFKEKYLNTWQTLVNRDAELENKKNDLKNVRKALEGYEVENKHLRELLKLWL